MKTNKDDKNKDENTSKRCRGCKATVNGSQTYCENCLKKHEEEREEK